MDVACGCVLSGGCIVVVGISSGPISVPLPRMQRFEIRIQGSGMYLPTDIDRAIKLIASGQVDVGPLISQVRSLEKTPEAYLAAESPETVKVLVRMN